MYKIVVIITIYYLTFIFCLCFLLSLWQFKTIKNSVLYKLLYLFSFHSIWVDNCLSRVVSDLAAAVPLSPKIKRKTMEATLVNVCITNNTIQYLHHFERVSNWIKIVLSFSFVPLLSIISVYNVLWWYYVQILYAYYCVFTATSTQP